MRQIQNLLTDEEIARIIRDPLVQSNRETIGGTHRTVSFDIALPQDIAQKVSDMLQISWPSSSRIPMRWIHGDSPMHIDRAWDHNAFTTTHLIYLTDSDGSLVIGDVHYPIRAGDGYMFAEGLPHGTQKRDLDTIIDGPFQ